MVILLQQGGNRLCTHVPQGLADGHLGLDIAALELLYQDRNGRPASVCDQRDCIFNDRKILRMIEGIDVEERGDHLHIAALLIV